MPKTINATQMRVINRSAVLELIRQKSPIARSQIGRELGLSLPTVMRIVDSLLEEGIILYTGEKEWSRGRRRQLLAYNKHNSLVIGVDLGGTKIFGTLANVGGEILSELYMEWQGCTAEEKYATLVDLIEQLLHHPQINGAPVRGIAIGAPGLTYSRSGVVRWSPALNWRDVPLKDRLQKAFGLPVFVDNDVNLAVLGEQHFGAGQGVRNLALIAIGTGMGAGLIVDGTLYRGEHEASGEVGYLLPDRNALGVRYDAFGAMESVVSGSGIAARARDLLVGSVPTEELERLSAKEVFDAARRQQAWALDIVNETVEYLTLTIANLCTIMDPEMVILGGGVAYSADILIPLITQQLQGLIPYPPRLVASDLGYRAAVMGAIALTVLETSDIVGILD